jgi:hypothetical protein
VGRHIDAEREAQAALRTQFYRLVVFQFACQALLNVLVVGWSLYALFQATPPGRSRCRRASRRSSSRA